MHLQRNVFTLLDNTASTSAGSRPAVGFEGTTTSFVELRDRALTVAAGLQKNGVQAGDHVAVMLGNRLEWVEVFFALARLGAVCVPVNVLLTGNEIAHVCRDSGARTLVVDEIGNRAIAGLEHEFALVVVVGAETSVPPTQAVVEYAALADTEVSLLTQPGPDLDDTFILYYSSGTTGLPKAAVHTHNGVLWNMAGQVVTLQLTPDIRYAVIPSLSWAAGFHNLMLGLVAVGGYCELRRTGSADAHSIVDFIVDHDITHVMLVPSLLRGLAARPDLMDRLDSSSLRWVVTGAEPVPRAVLDVCVKAMSAVAICQGYGLSEFPTIATVLQPHEVADHEGGAGRPVAFTSLAIRDDNGVIGHSGRGELLIRSPSSMRGYFGNPDQTEKAFRDGWLHTGDLVDLSEDGHITVVGRTKDMIISGGLNIYPKEVEDILHRLPGVAEAAVVGVPDERFGEAAVAVIVTSGDEFDEDVVRETCRAQLASYKRPREVLIHDHPLPRSANAKLLKRELRVWAADQLATK
ncbi:acyl--CoA ligase [Actinomadura madurae]|uniref:class I adenylate-forming enzyme family protein n=1 Tax=Actinomadura madurae TaxID=1993 RepID=UPI003999C78A